jgi:hypothetical protein
MSARTSVTFAAISASWLLCLLIGCPVIRECHNANIRTYVDSCVGGSQWVLAAAVASCLIQGVPVTLFEKAAILYQGHEHTEHGRKHTR